MIETQQKTERVVLLGVALQDTVNMDMSMQELAGLAQTAGAEVVATYTQKRDRYDSKTFVGSGKLDELKAVLDGEEIDTVIVNNRLTPRQNSHLEAVLGVKVIDRMQLILDIFAMRARSHEGKLQVHLAQLKYMLPRLVGQGVMLSRQAGGIGSRGPGESQLELNRRSIRHQITDIERQLKQVEANRQTIRDRRVTGQVFKIGLIGYTNAGKSTIMNALTDKSQYEADELFATLDATTKQIYLDGSFKVTLTDTVGFIQDLPTELVAAFKSTLEESRHVDMLVHVIDASDPNHETHEQVVLELLNDLEMGDLPRLTLYNKADLAQQFEPTIFPHVLMTAKADKARHHLRQVLVDFIKGLFVPFDLQLTPDQLYQVYDFLPLVLLDGDWQEDLHLSGYIAKKDKWRLEAFYD